MRPDRSVLQAVLGGTMLFGLLAVVSLIYSSGGGGADERLVILMLVNVVLVSSMQIFIGNTGVLSFGHIVFPAVGGYAAAVVGTPAVIRAVSAPEPPFGLENVEVSFVAAMVIGVAVALVFAAFFGAVVCRISGLGAAILSFSLLVVVHQTLLNWSDLTGGAQGIYGIPAETTMTVALAAAFASILLARLFKDSRAGLWAQATREDELAATAMGASAARARYVPWLTSAAIGGLGGVLLSFYRGAITPNEFYIDLTFTILAFLILGGMRSVTGAVIGTMTLTAVLEVARNLATGPSVMGVDLPEVIGLQQLCLGATILAVMFWRPAGLLGDHELDDLLWRRWLTKRKSHDVGSRSEMRPAVRTNNPPPLISTDRLSKDFEGISALSGVSLAAHAGEIVGVIGPNGAGKTTLLNVLSGNLVPTNGTVEFNGHRIDGCSSMEIARMGIARTFQNLRLFDSLTVRDNVEVSVSLAARYRSQRERLSTAELLDEFRLTEQASHRAQTLAQGDRRRLEMARAVGLSPSLLLLDEPTAGMNDLESNDLLSRIRDVRSKFGCGVIVVDHNVPFMMELCESMLVLHGGKEIAFGTPAEIQQHRKVIDAYLGRSTPLEASKTDDALTHN